MRALSAALLALTLLLPMAGLAVEPDEILPDAGLEQRARDISHNLRCLVCQNESIDDSHASLARDLRLLVRERLKAGDSDEQIYSFLTQRYGDFVLLRPPIRPGTWLLWFGPALLLIAGAVGSIVWLRRRQSAAPAAPLSEDEKRDLAALLDRQR
ncbi:MAG: cytochrome c-type biogenesis protein [Rhodospirillales bacterium]